MIFVLGKIRAKVRGSLYNRLKLLLFVIIGRASWASVQKKMKRPLYVREILLDMIPENSIGEELQRMNNGFIRRIQKNRLLEMLPKGSVGVEIGVQHGRFSKKILSAVKPSCLHLVDPCKQISIFQENVKFWEMTSDEFFDSFAGKVDWIYIDGDHRYDFVLRDLNGASSIIKDGGIIWGDDFKLGSGPDKYQVKEALIKFCEDNQRKYIVISNQFIVL